MNNGQPHVTSWSSHQDQKLKKAEDSVTKSAERAEAERKRALEEVERTEREHLFEDVYVDNCPCVQDEGYADMMRDYFALKPKDLTKVAKDWWKPILEQYTKKMQEDRLRAQSQGQGQGPGGGRGPFGQHGQQGGGRRPANQGRGRGQGQGQNRGNSPRGR
eukprot:TRINITY_DN9260_c0_g1_i1.p1 TRINITY_DN9260_c0_g1~~TRINITY_DN9260_c0_g1_i1.p1  ORF type:complete len:161 (+),score=19.73 TRINITY_DN9260_c0_g1_i1:233-715(+)